MADTDSKRKVYYISEAIYQLAGEHKVTGLYVKRDGPEGKYDCVAYDPVSYHKIDSCSFTEPLLTMDDAAAKAIEIMHISCAHVIYLQKGSRRVETTQTPDLKIQALKTLADKVCPQDYDSEVIHNILEIIKEL